MSKSILEGILQDETVTYTIVELSEQSVLDLALLNEMIEMGIIEPIQTSPVVQSDYRALNRVQKASRLHQELSINLEGISVVLDLLERVQLLEQELMMMKGKSEF